jgi:superfamily II DNA or RNA helicase
VTVVLVPSIALAAQTITDWYPGGSADRVLAVCSDNTVGGGGVRAADLPVPVTTDAEVIAKWLVGAPPGALVVGTYDSAGRVADGLRQAGIVAELTVCDEAHRLAGTAGKVTAAVLETGVLPDRRRLFMTATPRICTGTSADGTQRAISMDDEEVFGPVAYRYPFRQAISEGWLKDYRIVIATVISRQVTDLLEGNSELTGDGDVPIRMAAAQAAFAMTAAQFGLRRCVAFLPRVAQARQFALSLPATLAMLPPSRRPSGPLSAGYVHGKMSSVQWDLALDRLRYPPDSGWAVVANSRCLTEGVDIPAIDSVLFGAPKESVIDIVQAVGRALRRHGDTDIATVIVPALIPDAEDQGEAGPDATGNRYENVLRVVRAMCAHDDDLADELQAARARRAADPVDQPPGLPSRITVLAPPGTLQATLDALGIHVLTRISSSWWDGYGAARAYYDSHGDLDVPTTYVTPNGFGLGTWLTVQRADRNRSAMPPDRIRLLDRIAMIWDRYEAAWMAAYHELRAYSSQHGHFEVPAGYRTADGVKLSEWQGTQRDNDRAGTLTSARRALLDAIGFPWDPAESRWMRRYHQLTDALTRHGSPSGLPPGSPEATWLEGQHLAHHRGKLPAGKVTLLEQAGVTIRRPGPDTWMTAYQAVADFKAEHGHLRIPAGYTGTAGIDLCDWQRDQRVRRKAGRITSEQERLLTEAGFCWDPATDTWNARYQDAAIWKHEHGNLDLPRRHPVKDWLYRQQKLHDNGRLPADRAGLLRELGALTDPPPGGTRKPQRRKASARKTAARPGSGVGRREHDA